MAKYENIRALAKKQLQAVTESSDRWKAFLRTAAIAYNYSFPNQLLIHEQSPTATAVADIAYWNNNAGRWVKRGAHGIAVFDTRANSSRLRYLFDISDTIPRAEIPEALPWVITDQNWRPVWDKIVADNHADSIQSALLMLSTSCVAQRSAMFTTALGKAIDGSSLQWAIMAFITSSGTLDKKDDRARKYIAERCDLIGAVRLPNNAFKGSGTKIMTDVIFLQKRDTLRQQDEPWLHLAEDANGITMNHYFVEHPEMICGKMEIVAGPYGPTSTCQPIDPNAVDRFGKPLLETQIDTAMQHLTATLTKAEISVQEESGEDTKYIDADPFVRNFSYTVKDDKIYYREGAVMRECNPNAASAERIRKLVELRDTTRALIDAQLQDLSDEEIHRLQGQLNRQYDAFRAKHGLINSRSAELSFRDDSSYYLLCSLENVDEKGNFISKSDMFTKRTIRSAQIPDHADTASDALALSIGERAKVDMPYMMHLTGKDEATLAKELAGVIFVEPFRKQEDGSPVYLMADEYLSGNVREKLRVAHVAADQDPAFRINVEALEQVQPKDLTAGEITVRLGVTWIGSEIIKQFADELFQSTYREQKIAVRYNEYLNNWYISNKSQGNGPTKSAIKW